MSTPKHPLCIVQMGSELSVFLRPPLQFWDYEITGMFHRDGDMRQTFAVKLLFCPFLFFPHSYIFSFSYP